MGIEQKDRRWVEVGGKVNPRFLVTRERIDMGDGSPLVEALRFDVHPDIDHLFGNRRNGGSMVEVEDLRELLRLYDEEPERLGMGRVV